MEPMLELGAKYRDIATGFEGTATSVTHFLYSCDRVWLVKGHNDKGEEIAAAFDVTGLALVEHAPQELADAIARSQPVADPIEEPTVEPEVVNANVQSPPQTEPPHKTGGDRPMSSARREDTHRR